MGPRRATRGGGVGLLGVSSLASAQEWILDPRLELGATYNDNIRVTSIRGQEIEVYGPTLDAQVTARKEAQAWSIEATPHLTANYFRMQNPKTSITTTSIRAASSYTQRTRTWLDFPVRRRKRRVVGIALSRFSGHRPGSGRRR